MTEIDQEAVRKLLELELPPDNDAHVPTARAWLAELLKIAWLAKDDAFKRPFGFSGPWWDELYAAMVRAELVEGELDEEGDLDYVGADADALILAVIDAMGQPQATAEAADETPRAVVVACGLTADNAETSCLHWYRSASDAKAETWELLTVSGSGLYAPPGADLTGCEDWARDAARAAVALRAGRLAEAAGYATHRLGGVDEPHIVPVNR